MPKKTIQILKVFRELFNERWRYIVFYGGRSSGKSQQIGRALLIRGREKKLRILCTREVQNTIKDSVHKLLKDIIEQYGFGDYEVQNDTIVNRITGTEFIFKGLRQNIAEIKSTEGIDICWIEEAQNTTKANLDIITPTIRKPGSQIIVSFNRYNELDPIYVKFVQNPPSNSYVRKVNFDHLERAGLLPDVIKQEMEDDKATPSLYAHKWLGEPISQSEMGILSRDMVLEAMNRETDGDGQDIYAVDVARMGGDRTVFWHRKGLKTIKNAVHTKLRTTQVCDQLEQFMGFNKEAEVKIDDTGVGGGVTDEMMKRGYKVKAINFGGVAQDKDKYPNWISEAWFHMLDILPEADLPYISDLLMELTTRQWNQDTKGKRRVESKIDYKKRGFRSPDMADACIICYGEAVEPSILDFYRDKGQPVEAE
jgi:phage terminase large subunit